MTRTRKTLGLVLLTLLATALPNASTASAVDVFTSANGGKVLVTAITHNSVFKLTSATGLTIECTTARFAGTIENGSTEAAIDTEYSGKINETPHGTACSSTIGTVTLDTNGCQTKTTGATTGSDEGKTDATVWMVCEVGKQVVITSSLGLTLSFPSQTPTSGGATSVNLPNHPGGAAIQATGTWTGVTYTCAPAFTCGLAGIPTHGDNVDINGSAIFTGYEDNEGLPTPITEGAQVGISIS